MSTVVDMHVDATAFKALRAELYGFDRELLGKLNSRMKRAVEPAKAQAEAAQAALGLIRSRRDNAPSGLAKAYLAGPKSIKVKVGGRTSREGQDAVVRLQVVGKAQGIAEFAAHSSTPQGAALVAKLDQFGGPGRFVWEAVDQNVDQIEADIAAEVRKTEAEFSARLRSGASTGVVR
jgi:hypothetical protein